MAVKILVPLRNGGGGFVLDKTGVKLEENTSLPPQSRIPLFSLAGAV